MHTDSLIAEAPAQWLHDIMDDMTDEQIGNTVTTEQAWDTLETLGVSEQTLQIITSINGYTLDTLGDVLYAHTGYRSFDQVEEGIDY